MSVLIRDMDMPKEGTVLVIDSCGEVWSNTWPTMGYIREDKAKAVEVPTPHGRLIDADALMELYEPAPEDANEWEHYTTTISVIRQNIKDAPTVIEAEE